MKKPLRMAIAGFRHAHIFDVYQRILARTDVELAATCEEHFEASLLPERNLKPDFVSLDEMLSKTDCQIVALGDAYRNRGAQAIAVLESGRHVLADKPLCTSLDEWREIQRLSQLKGLCVGLMLDIRDHANWITLRKLVQSGRIGEVQTVCFSGQHPLLWGHRPGWYFEPGRHGGTLNDIGIHAVDFIPWLTGHSIEGVVAARTWNAKATAAPHFNDCAQMMLRLSNGGGAIGDVSYLAPDGSGYLIPQYWRVTLHGLRGLAETSIQSSGVTVADDGSDAPETIPSGQARPGGYLEDFLACVRGQVPQGGLDTHACLEASRLALEMEAHARS